MYQGTCMMYSMQINMCGTRVHNENDALVTYVPGTAAQLYCVYIHHAYLLHKYTFEGIMYI